MAISDSDQESSKDYSDGFEEEDFSSDYGSDPDYDSGSDPSFCIDEGTRAKFQNFNVAKNSDLSAKKESEELEINLEKVDEKSYENVQKIIQAGKVEKLKLDQCKVYLRKNGLRLSGNKDILIQRVKEHLEILNGGEKKYPPSSFVLNCKGDACTGDVVMFEQNVYEMFNIASRSASGPPCGTRIVAGRIVKESYGAAKQQHTFTIEVLWSKGEKPLPPLHPLLIKGRNLYKLKTLRQRWEDEGERQKVLLEKHSRGSLARSDREVRIQEKEKRKMLRTNRILKKEESNKNQSQFRKTRTEIRSQLPGSSRDSGLVAPQHQQSGLTDVEAQVASKTHGSESLFALEHQNVHIWNSIESSRIPEVQLQKGDKFHINHRQTNFHNRYQNSINEKSMTGGMSRLPERNYQLGSGIPEVELRTGDNFHTNYRQTNFHRNKYQNPPINDKSMTSGMSKLPEISHRHQLKNMNHGHPATQPQRQGFLTQQLCRYYAQGRCYYGENCKFLHGARERRYQR